MNKVKSRLMEILGDGRVLCLKELYSLVGGSPAIVRAVLNLSIKNNDGVFVRVAKGKYSIYKK